MHFIH